MTIVELFHFLGGLSFGLLVGLVLGMFVGTRDCR